MSDYLLPLRQKIDSLVDEAREIRECLQNCLDVATRRPVDALALARGIGETLAKRSLSAIGVQPPAMLDACLRELEKPEVMSRGLVPAEIITMLHKVRTFGNKAIHGVLRVTVTVEGVACVLGDIIWVIQWFYCEFTRGPKLERVFRNHPSPVAILGAETRTPESVLELIAVVDVRANAVLSWMEEVKKRRADAVISQELARIAQSFASLHQQHREQLLSGNYVAAHEVVRLIHRLIRKYDDVAHPVDPGVDYCIASGPAGGLIAAYADYPGFIPAHLVPRLPEGIALNVCGKSEHVKGIIRFHRRMLREVFSGQDHELMALILEMFHERNWTWRPADDDEAQTAKN